MPQKEENNLLVNLNLDGEKSRKEENKQQSQRNHLLLQSFSIREVRCGNRILTLFEPPRIPLKPSEDGHQPFSALWLFLHSRINLPVTFSIKLGNCAEATNPENQFLDGARLPPVPLCWDTTTGHHQDQGVSAWKLSPGE